MHERTILADRCARTQRQASRKSRYQTTAYRHFCAGDMRCTDCIGRSLKALVCECQAQQANKQPTNGRHGQRQDNEPALIVKPGACRRRDEQQVVKSQNHFDKADRDDGDHDTRDEAQQCENGYALEQ